MRNCVGWRVRKQPLGKRSRLARPTQVAQREITGLDPARLFLGTLQFNAFCREPFIEAPDNSRRRGSSHRPKQRVGKVDSAARPAEAQGLDGQISADLT